MSKSKFKTILPFHGALLTVVENEGVDYIPLKPIVDMLGIQWKSARIKAFSGDNLKLYGTCELNQPVFNTFDTDIGAKKTVHILLEATEMFLARVNTTKIRKNGDECVADLILNLQKEWRLALHELETVGVAFKKSRGTQRINALAKIDNIKNPELKRIAAQEANADFGLNICLGSQEPIPLNNN